MKQRLLIIFWLVPLVLLYVTDNLIYCLIPVVLLGYYEIIYHSQKVSHGIWAIIHMSGLLFLTQMSESVIWFNILIVVTNDVAAYIGGRYLLPFGSPLREKIFPKTSPNKTIGGFVFGVVFSVFAGYVFVYVFSWSKIWLLLSLITALLAVAGDYYESLFKRRSHIKDSGQCLFTSKLLPGHGGVYDRFDALAFSAFFVWIFDLIFK